MYLHGLKFIFNQVDICHLFQSFPAAPAVRFVKCSVYCSRQLVFRGENTLKDTITLNYIIVHLFLDLLCLDFYQGLKSS